MERNNNVPFQVQQIIQSLLNPKDSVHLRGNYRLRLVEIREEIDKAIRRYDNELMLSGTPKGKRKKAS